MSTCKNTIFYRSLCNSMATSLVLVVLIFFCIEPGQNIVKAEYYSSVDKVNILGAVEKKLLEIFRYYLEEKKNEIDSYRRFIEHIKLQHSIADEDVDDYLGNPINAFTLIKRMVTDWSALKESIQHSAASQSLRENIEFIGKKIELPDDNDLKGAAKSIVRLQEVYKLNADELVNGKINDINVGTSLTWHECFEIATNLFDVKHYSYALIWFETTLKKLKNPEEKNESKDEAKKRRRFLIETLEYIALTYRELGNNAKAIKYIDEILKIEPDHSSKDIRIYLLHTPSKEVPKTVQDKGAYWNKYLQLCRGIQETQKGSRTLKCRLDTMGNPYFIYAPIKVEELHRDPEIRVYHGLLNDAQIQQILRNVGNSLKRATVSNGTDQVVFDGRVGQNSWLEIKSPIVKHIYRLVEDITGFDSRNAENMEFVNYGIGGMYEPHFDFDAHENLDPRLTADRLMTNMFYLSDVQKGGFTVFPQLNVISQPAKGSMISWFNLHRSLAPDYRTSHAGCPVIIGTKRIANVWIHASQKFR